MRIVTYVCAQLFFLLINQQIRWCRNRKGCRLEIEGGDAKEGDYRSWGIGD